MSDKLPMPKLEKTSLRLDVSALMKSKMERLSALSGLSVNAYANALIAQGLSGIPTLPEDVKRAQEIIEGNIERRNIKKAEKGIR